MLRAERVMSQPTGIPTRRLTQAYKDAIQGTQHADGTCLLAAPDGSCGKDKSGVGKDKSGVDVMGADNCFKGDVISSLCFQVGSDATSLRAEVLYMCI